MHQTHRQQFLLESCDHRLAAAVPVEKRVGEEAGAVAQAESSADLADGLEDAGPVAFREVQWLTREVLGSGFGHQQVRFYRWEVLADRGIGGRAGSRSSLSYACFVKLFWCFRLSSFG